MYSLDGQPTWLESGPSPHPQAGHAQAAVSLVYAVNAEISRTS